MLLLRTNVCVVAGMVVLVHLGNLRVEELLLDTRQGALLGGEAGLSVGGRGAPALSAPTQSSSAAGMDAWKILISVSVAGRRWRSVRVGLLERLDAVEDLRSRSTLAPLVRGSTARRMFDDLLIPAL